MNRGSVFGVVFGLWALVASVPVAAQEAPANRAAATAPAAGEISVDGDDVDYDRKRQMVTASGNVVVRRAGEELRADRIVVDLTTKIATATGNVTLLREGAAVDGDSITYNFATGRIVYETFAGFIAPFYVEAGYCERRDDGVYVIRDAVITTCEFTNHPHWRVHAKDALYYPNDRLKADNTVIYAGNLPFFYTPFWRKNLNEEAGLSIVPGYSSRMGAFLLSSYDYPYGENVRMATHLDLRSRRGVGLGQTIRWQGDEDDGRGDLAVYYADDNEPNESHEDPEAEQVDAERYRLRLNHLHPMDGRTTFRARVHYLSDPDVLEDFFDREHRSHSQPESFLSLTRRYDRHTANLVFQRHLHDFDDKLDRAPEASLDFARQQISGTALYYEGRTSLSALERVFDDRSGEADYDSFRADTAHTVYYPTKHAGFLNVIPRAGVRGTYYSDTAPPSSSGTNAPAPAVDTGPSEFRRLVEFGVESSFKAFKVWATRPDNPMNLDGLRHVVEPFINYTYRSRPNVEPHELLQFDGVDEIDKEHSLVVGVRNKLQTRDQGRSVDLVDIDAFTTLRIDRDPGEASVGNLFVDGELRVFRGMPIDFDGAYDVDNSQVEEFNVEVDVVDHGPWTLDLNHRYRREESSLLSASIDFASGESWGGNAFVRYEFEESQVEEEGIALRRTLDCLTAMVGVSYLPSYTESDGDRHESEVRAWLQVALTAFPEHQFDIGR